MGELNPQDALTFFEQNLPEFLSGDVEIEGLILDMKDSLRNEGSANFHANALDTGKNFIKHVITRSIQYLSDESDSPKNRSIRNITEYIDAFTVFEEMLFGLDTRYRDHTLHSLWVYLFGHQFIINIGGYDTIKIAGQMSIMYPDPKENKPKFILTTTPVEGSTGHLEAMWGMIAILHDLGYPVEAISNKPHDIFGRILDPFAIDFSSIFQIDLGSRIILLHQSVCDLLSTMYRPEALTAKETENYYKDANEKSSQRIVNFIRQPTTVKAEALEMEFRIASVDKIHSAWSAILSFKNIAYLHESDYHGGGNRNYLQLLTKRDILYSIVHHTSEGPKDDAVNRFQFILLLMDDIEEAIRYSRGGKERGLVSDYCKVKWKVNAKKTEIELDYTKYNSNAQSKYTEIENKYKSQLLRGETDYPYEIKIRFLDEKFNEELKLHLVKDE